MIGLDLRCLPTDGSDGSGVAHASRELCVRLAQNPSLHCIAYVPRDADFSVHALRRDRVTDRVDLEDAGGSALRRALRKTPCDLLIVPTGAVPPRIVVPAVPWVHDLTIFSHPELFPQSLLKRFLTTRLFLHGLRRAPLVLSVSEYTKKEIVRYAGISQDKIIVTGEGGDDVLRSMDDVKVADAKIRARRVCRNEWGIVRPFVLALGTLEPRKNLAMLVRAWKKSGVPLDLVLAGSDGWKFDDVIGEIDALSEKERVGLHRMNRLDDEQKRTLLLAASTVAVPSLDEGFGLVALEALQARTRLLASNRGAMPEVVGKAGKLLDPENEGEWIDALKRIVADDRPKIFGSVGLGATVNAMRGSKPKNQVVVPNSQDGSKNPDRRFLESSWERTAGIVAESLKRHFPDSR